MYLKQSKALGVTVINLVRKDSHVQELKSKHGQDTIVLNTSEPGFMDNLKQEIEKHKPTLMFEVLGGSVPGDILKEMPEHSVMVTMGNLSHERIQVDSEDLHWAQKEVSGLMLGSFLGNLTDEEKKVEYDKVAEDLALAEP